MFTNILKRNSAILSKLFNQLSNQPALATAGGKVLNTPPLFDQNFIDYTHSVGNEVRKYNKVMHEACKRATNEIFEKDEREVEQRIKTEHEGKIGVVDVAYEQAQAQAQAQQTQEGAQGRKSTGVNRQYEKWTKEGSNDDSRFYKGAKDTARKQGEDWAQDSQGSQSSQRKRK